MTSRRAETDCNSTGTNDALLHADRGCLQTKLCRPHAMNARNIHTLMLYNCLRQMQLRATGVYHQSSAQKYSAVAFIPEVFPPIESDKENSIRHIIIVLINCPEVEDLILNRQPVVVTRTHCECGMTCTL